MLRFWTQIQLEVTDCVLSVGQKSDLLVQLEPLRFQDLVEASFRFRVHRLHKAKPFAGGGLLVLIAGESQGTLANDDLKVMLLCVPIPHVAPVNTHGDWPIRDGQGTPIAWTALDKTPLFLTQLRFTALGHLQGIVPHRLDVECDIERQEVSERIDSQTIRDE